MDMVQTVPRGAHEWIFGSTSKISGRGDISLLERSVHLIKPIGIAAGAFDNPEESTFQDHRDGHNKDGHDRVHDNAALKEPFQKEIAFSPSWNEASHDGLAVTGGSHEGSEFYWKT